MIVLENKKQKQHRNFPIFRLFFAHVCTFQIGKKFGLEIDNLFYVALDDNSSFMHVLIAEIKRRFLYKSCRSVYVHM